jgi:hypothetical protein
MAKDKKSDFYPTPPLLAKAGVDLAIELSLFPNKNSDTFSILEPGAGIEAPFLTAACNWESKYPKVSFSYQAVEQHQLVNCATMNAITHIGGQKKYFYECDFLQWQPRYIPHLIATNPPFSQAEAFVRHACGIVHPLGLVMMLLRSTFEGSKGRRPFWAGHKPFLRAVVRPRPNFKGNGRSDMSEYAFYFWAGSRLARFMSMTGGDRCDTIWVDSPLEKGWIKR